MNLPVPLSIILRTDRRPRRITKEARDLRFRDVAPGGYASAVVPLNRPLTIQPDEIAYYGRLAVVDNRNGEVVWDGRLEDPARAAGSAGEVWELAAVGPSAHASDRTVPLIYVDQDLTSLARVVNAKPGGRDAITEDPGGSGSEALVLQFPTGLAIVTNDRVTMRYSRIWLAGQKLARVAYFRDAGRTDSAQQTQSIPSSGPGGAADTIASNNWSTVPNFSFGVVGSNWTNGRDTLDLRINRSGTALTVPDDTYWASLWDLRIRAMLKDASGNDLTTGYNSSTVKAHEVVADLLGRLLTSYDGATAIIATTTHSIDQLAYPDGVTARRVLDDLMMLEPAYYWAAWEQLANGKHRFEWSPWPTEVRYETSVVDGYDSTGSADGLYDAVRVRWRDARGEIRTTRRTQTVPELAAAGISREAFIDLGDEMGSQSNADRAGDQYLTQHMTAPNAGRLTIARPIRDRIAGRMVQPWEIRSGNLIRVRGILPRVDALNASDSDGVTVFRIKAKDFSASRVAATLELDSDPLTVAHALGEIRRQAVTRRR